MTLCTGGGFDFDDKRPRLVNAFTKGAFAWSATVADLFLTMTLRKTKLCTTSSSDLM